MNISSIRIMSEFCMSTSDLMNGERFKARKNATQSEKECVGNLDIASRELFMPDYVYQPYQ